MTEKRKGWYRRPRTPEAFPNFGAGKCLYCGADLPKGRRKFCSDLHSFNYRMASRKYDIITWAEIREQAFKRDNYTCQQCHTEFPPHSEALEGHHKIPIYAGGAEFDLDNVETLCSRCHSDRKGKELEFVKNKKIESFSGGT